MENLKTILNACLRVYGADFTINNRSQKNVYARAAYYNLCRERTNHSYASIGKVCGDRDHSTVIHAIRKADAYTMIETYRKLYGQFENQINGIMEFKTENEIETYHSDLLEKISLLELENEKLRTKLYGMETVKMPKEPIQIRVTKAIMELPDEVLQEFEQYRLLPFLKLQEFKVLN